MVFDDRVSAFPAFFTATERLVQAFQRRHPGWFAQVETYGKIAFPPPNRRSAHEALEAFEHHAQRAACLDEDLPHRRIA